MSQINNDLCLKGIEESRQVFKQVQTQTKQQTESQQNVRQIEVERIVETSQPSQYQNNNNYHPICIPQTLSYPITYKPYIIVQEQQMVERKSKKKKTKSVIEIQEQIKVQEIVNKKQKES